MSSKDSLPAGTTTAQIINAGIDSSLSKIDGHRGSLTASELEAIHQSKSYRQAQRLERLDNKEIATKTQEANNTEAEK